MSHIVLIQSEVRDPDALRLACTRLGLDEPVLGTVMLFSEQATGYCVDLPRWRYPAVFNVESGAVRYDTYEGRWGDRKHLDHLLQAYGAEKAKLEARKQGHTVSEQSLPDGSIKLVIQLGEAA